MMLLLLIVNVIVLFLLVKQAIAINHEGQA